MLDKGVLKITPIEKSTPPEAEALAKRLYAMLPRIRSPISCRRWRDAFEDDDEGHDRLLLRLWLSMPNSRALPAGHEAGALRGGIGQSGVPV